MMQKATQLSAQYGNGLPMKQCGLCSYYTHGATGGQFGGCTKVTGHITPYGLCRYWKMLANPFGHLMTGQDRAAIEQIYMHARARGAAA
jgi:hypothetical protein